jgi:Na+/H+-dicarboxylate symporter
MDHQSKGRTKGPLGWYLGSNLLYRILVGLLLGALLGIVFKENILWISPLGTLFVRLLKMIMMPIILSTIIVGASSVSPANLGRTGIRIILLYMLTSAFAVLIGLLMGAVFSPSAELATLAADAAGRQADAVPLSQTLLNIVPTSYAQAVVNENVLPVIFFSLLFGIGISYMRVSEDERTRHLGTTVYDFFDGVSTIMMKMVGGIMEYAPIGVTALVAEVFARNGSKVVGSLGVVTLATFLGYAIHIGVIYLGLVALNKLSVRTFFNEAKKPFITGFVTRSSNGTLPVTIKAAENLGVHKDIFSFSLPLGATINMDGTAIYQGVCATFIALSATGQGFSIAQMGTIIVTATLASIGTAGVPGAGALMLLMVLDAVGLPVVAGTPIAGAYAMILGIDAILDMGRTALNVTGDLTCTTLTARMLGELDMDCWTKS